MSDIYLKNTMLYKKAVAAREQSIKQNNEQLQKYIASNLELENFAYLASHDLRSPLQNVISFSKLLNRKLQPRMTAQEQQFFRYITEGSERMQETIEALLRFSLVNNNDIHLEKANLTEIFDDIQDDLHQLITDSQAIIEICEMPSNIFIDTKLFRELLLNLISNAIKFARKDEKPNIVICCEESERQYLFSVADNGIGIEPEAQDLIFGIFKRLHLQEEYEGTEQNGIETSSWGSYSASFSVSSDSVAGVESILTFVSDDESITFDYASSWEVTETPSGILITLVDTLSNGVTSAEIEFIYLVEPLMEQLGIDDPRKRLSSLPITEWLPDEDDKNEESIHECTQCKTTFLVEWYYNNPVENEK